MDHENIQTEHEGSIMKSQMSFSTKKKRKRLKSDSDVSDNNKLKDDLEQQEETDASPEEQIKPKKRTTKAMQQTQYGDFLIKNNHIYRLIYNPKTEKTVEVEISRLLRIRTIQQDIENRSVELIMENFYQNQLQTKTISRKQLQKNKLSELVEYGFDITDSNVKALQNFLRVQENYADYQNTHKQLGWAEYNEQEVFKHHTLLGSTEKSHYNGTFKVEPQGSFEEWEKIIQSEVFTSTPLTLALVAGFASPVVAWIAKDFDLEVVLFHISGDSTMGKTTAARVFVSPFGAPTSKAGGTLLKWNGTSNGIIGHLVDNMGVPVAIDEASMNKMKDFTEMIYTLAEGTEKARMTKTLANRERRRWAGVLFSTAEHPLIEKTNHNTGLQVRMMELPNIQWTESKDHATKIKNALLNNYGHAGARFVEYLLKIGKEEITKKWLEWTWSEVF